MLKLTNNEVQFVCWGALTTLYLAVFVLIATISKELLFSPMLGEMISTPLSAIVAILLSYAMVWHFVCHTNIPTRSRAKWFVGTQFAAVFIMIQTIMSDSFMQSNQGFVGEAYHLFSNDLVITFVLITILVSPNLLSSHRDRTFNI